ncbi:unnamed protein product [Ceutorhynchus assimilis]|uniref:MADF domain-containing protein n=1 Tax=Ceutorhynchus assimilis TaxID=467358 RepID=A0A9N9MWI3_9CUCU|nr:unnamed protein product [Ceutorhynchus assimilis]
MKLKQILNEFIQIHPEAALLTQADIKKKINGLRSQFFNENNKINKSKRSGAGATYVYKPTWWCFDLLQFLSNSSTTRKSSSNLSSQEQSENSRDIDDSEELPDIFFNDNLEVLESEDNVENVPIVSTPQALPSASHFHGESSSQPGYSDKRKKRKINDEEKHQSTMSLLQQASSLLGQETSTEALDHIGNFAQYATTGPALGTDDPDIILSGAAKIKVGLFGVIMVGSELRNIKSPQILNKLKRSISQLLFDAQDEDQNHQF